MDPPPVWQTLTNVNTYGWAWVADDSIDEVGLRAKHVQRSAD
jgi:hypothetical protein